MSLWQPKYSLIYGSIFRQQILLSPPSNSSLSLQSGLIEKEQILLVKFALAVHIGVGVYQWKTVANCHKLQVLFYVLDTSSFALVVLLVFFSHHCVPNNSLNFHIHPPVDDLSVPVHRVTAEADCKLNIAFEATSWTDWSNFNLM